MNMILPNKCDNPIYPQVNHTHNEQGQRQTIDTLRTSPQGQIWEKTLSNECGRLSQGNVHGVQPTNTISFIYWGELPSNQDVIYASFVCDHRPLMSEPWRVRIVVGGDRLLYKHDTGSPAASLLETKILLNNTISDAEKGAHFMSLDLNHFFLATPMPNPEYMKVAYKYFPQDIIDKYELNKKVHQGYIYIKILKGMYGLKQAAVLAYENLIKNLEPFGYEPIPHTDSYWRHKLYPTKFCLCVDDFRVKYFKKIDSNHLISSLQTNYKISTDFSGQNYCGLTFDWEYKREFVDILIPDYIPKALDKFQHKPSKPQYSPHVYHCPNNGSKVQYAKSQDTSRPATKKETTNVQSVTGTFLYYCRTIDPTTWLLRWTTLQQCNPNTRKKP